MPAAAVAAQAELGAVVQKRGQPREGREGQAAVAMRQAEQRAWTSAAVAEMPEPAGLVAYLQTTAALQSEPGNLLLEELAADDLQREQPVPFLRLIAARKN